MAPATLEIVLPNNNHGGSDTTGPPFKHHSITDVDNSNHDCGDNHSLEGSESSDAPDLNMPRVVNGEDWNHISKPGAHDVLLGRGGGKS
jgi:hypothetical protein